ncbi:phosphoribosylglycinamide formyltransferase [Rhodobacteraceae bacterium NNCM2]|nr:phosphoribosylglycinamide formyltransferase [Coraliihabitans acroporae]
MKRVGILLSGTGSNMVALVEGMQASPDGAQPALVLSNNPDAPGLAKAAALGVPTAVVDHRPFKGDRVAFEAEVNARLAEAGIELLALAGFMRILTPGTIAHWQGRMINIHPSLLPLFKGLHTHARALEEGVAVHGCTAHIVTDELDSGPILGQAVVPVKGGDTPETLAARVLRAEHQLYPKALQAFARDPEGLLAAPISILGVGDDG